jgi:polyphosphate kinase
VVRREADGLRRYVHLGTGNYSANPYADLSLFTCHPEIGADVTDLFNLLTGRSRQHRYHHLLVAPFTVRSGLLERIEREIACHLARGGGHLMFKVNALVDPQLIDALYRASAAGVQVDLIVRGMCCVRPGVPGLSEHIRVRSIVGRFLEHSRVFYFRNNGNEEIFIGSADLMERNLDRRIEALAPVLDRGLARALKTHVLDLQLQDNVRATELGPDGRYYPIVAEGAPRVDAQHRWATTDLSLLR